MEKVEISMAATTTTTDDDDLMKEMKAYADSKQGVKGLVDAGITSIPKFFLHAPDTIPTQILSPSADIPIIDLTSSQDHQSTITQLKSAASTWGFFQIINHGIPTPILNSAIKSIKAFHEQTSELKAQYYLTDMRNGSGFTSNGDLFWAKQASWYDHLQIRMTPEPIDFDAIIPDVCRKEMMDWAEEVKKLGRKVLGLLAEGLGLESSRFEDIGLLDERRMAGIYYPPCPQPELTVGMRNHTDRGSITILGQNEVVGLQVKHGDVWVDVKPLPGALIVNIGDTLEIVSNGEYKSVLHQVRATDASLKEARVSIAQFFMAGKEDFPYGPLPELLSPQKPAAFATFTLEEFRDMFSSRAVGSKSLVQRLRL